MKYLAFISVLILFISCDSTRVYEENVDIDDAIWKLSEKPVFRFNIEDETSVYNIKLNLRNGISYPFHNIYLKYWLLDSTENEVSSELREFFLFDVKTGQPKGDGLGDIFDHQFSVLEKYQFPAKGRYSIRIEQYMRLDSLPMILSLGTRIEKAQ